MSGIDEILIGRIFSPAAGWLEHRLGLGQWRIAIECLNGHVACYLAGVAFAIAGKGVGDGIFMDLLAALLWLCIMEVVRRAAMRQAGSSMGVQTARLGERHFRCIVLIMLPVSLCYVEGWASGFYTASLALLTMHLYLERRQQPQRQRRIAPVRARAASLAAEESGRPAPPFRQIGHRARRLRPRRSGAHRRPGLTLAP